MVTGLITAIDERPIGSGFDFRAGRDMGYTRCPSSPNNKIPGCYSGAVAGAC